jgi:uncharacterized membrane protein YkoI
LPKPYRCIQIAFKAATIEGVDMKTRITLFLALAAITATAAPAMKPKADQEGARKQMSDGKVLSLRQIEAKVLPRMKGMEYLGPEYYQDTKVYRLKFVDDGRVIFVDVDARSGSIIGQR